MQRINSNPQLVKPFLPVLLLLAALVGGPLTIHAQQAANTQPANPSLQASAAQPEFHANPEHLGDLRLVQRRYQAAIEQYKMVPHPSANLWNKMGIAYQMMFAVKDATRCYKKSLRLDPRNAKVWNNLGTAYDAQKNYGKAEQMYRKALKIKPKSAIFAMNLGTNLMVQNKYGEGWKMYQRAMELNPHIFDAPHNSVAWNTMTPKESGAINYYKAKSYAQAGMADHAIRFLRRALNEGFTNVKQISHDSSFTTLHGNPRFEQMMTIREKQ